MRFYLGTHQTNWLQSSPVPLCVSRRRLVKRKKFPEASCDWVCDSGGYKELELHGEWTVDAKEYVSEVRLYSDQIGRMKWAAPLDMMCEPDILKKTGLTVPEHQRLTMYNLVELRMLAPEIEWLPVLQGYTRDEYLRAIDLYAKAGVDLENEPIVGLGSICRRQGTKMVEDLIGEIGQYIRLHGFGLKKTGLRNTVGLLYSADSMAWSYDARRAEPIQGHTHKNCANCFEYAMKWRESLIAGLVKPYEDHIFWLGVGA